MQYQVGHFSRDCPKPKGYGKGSASGGSGGDKPSPSTASGAAMVVEVPHSEMFLVSSPGYGIIDSGCGKTLVGQQTLNDLFRMYHERALPLPCLRKEQHLFRFGNQQEEMAQFAVKLPIGINGRAGHVDAAVISGTAPLLLNTMKSLGAVLDFNKETLSLGGGFPKKLTTNSAGQYVVSILDFPSDATPRKLDHFSEGASTKL